MIQPETTSPFSPDPIRDANDAELVCQALGGERSALEFLIRRHQPWIYNLAFRMVMVAQDAEDVTQEILVKILTKLSTFDASKAAFRTWLYRMVANHVINMRTRGYEAAISRVEDYYSFIAQVPDEDPDSSPDTQLVISDLSIGCVMGVFLCLEREQRLAFILAVGFNVSDAEGSEILGMSEAGFRKLLSRARNKLRQYTDGNCGLFNENAPCRCHKKVTGFMRAGAYGPQRLTFVQPGAPTLATLMGDRIGRFSDVYAEYARLIRDQPFYRAPEVIAWLRDLVAGPEFNEIFSLREGQDGTS
jgi:RNA polymerase sigma factor (sigma-70 family)